MGHRREWWLAAVLPFAFLYHPGSVSEQYMPAVINFPIDLNRWLTLAVQAALVGLAAGDIVSQDLLPPMADDPIIFAMANPTPEIGYEEIKKAREDTVIMATGRSDSPN